MFIMLLEMFGVVYEAIGVAAEEGDWRGWAGWG